MFIGMIGVGIIGGTKWNAYETPDDRDTEDTIYFQTAWSDVFRLIKKISRRYPDLEFIYEWADEDIGRNAGICTACAGIIDIKRLDNESHEAYVKGLSLWPSMSKYYRLENGKYVYYEED